MNPILKKYLPLFLAVFIGVSITAGSFYGYLYLLYHPQLLKKKAVNPYEGYLYRNPTLNPITYLSPTPTVIPTPVAYTSVNPGTITWLQFPKTVSMSPYQVNESGYVNNGSTKASDIKYHHVADFADGSKLINAIFPEEGMGTWYTIHRFILSPNGQVYFLANLSTRSYTYNGKLQVPDYLHPSVKISDLMIDGVYAPEVISIPQGSFQRTSYFMDNTISFTELKSPVLMTETPYGRLYAVYENVTKEANLKVSGGIYDRKFWLRLKDDTIRAYQLVPSFLSDDKIPQISWSDGVKNSQAYSIGFKGKCGQGYGSILKPSSPVLSSINSAGKTFSGDDVYAISDPSSPLLDDIYSNLSSETKPDKDTFLSQRNHFLWKDGFGEWWLFLSELNQIQAECGKPVIYLYPKKDTRVSVQVGASITKSEPLYPASGWTVLAHPNGQLDYQGGRYSNLFWEGTGLGFYPNKEKEGFVVAQKDLITTIKNHLSLLGLNSQESADFMDFWQSKLPTTPYVRLTWLNTNDMDRLAPLKVSPSPDTVIRLFLEFEGLDQPITLKSQNLTSIPRQGFTLVEWGGLLRKN